MFRRLLRRVEQQSHDSVSQIEPVGTAHLSTQVKQDHKPNFFAASAVLVFVSTKGAVDAVSSCRSRC